MNLADKPRLLHIRAMSLLIEGPMAPDELAEELWPTLDHPTFWVAGRLFYSKLEEKGWVRYRPELGRYELDEVGFFWLNILTLFLGCAKHKEGCEACRAEEQKSAAK